MGKRSYKYIVSKLRKLERRFKKARREENPEETSSSATSSSSSSSDSESNDAEQPRVRQHPRTQPAPLCLEDVPGTSTAYVDPNAVTAESEAATAGPNVAATGSNVATTGPNAPTAGVNVTPAINNNVDTAALSSATIGDPQPSTSGVNNERVEDPIILELLGEDPTVKRIYGEAIQTDLATRLIYIAKNGLSKENKKELLEKYLIPENCTLIDAPALNAEIKAATVDTIIKRDKGIESRQKQIAAATTSIARTLTNILESEQRNATHIHMLMDALKLLCDSQFNDSMVRRNFILGSLRKDLKEQLQATKIDELLFGKELADTLKTAKAIIKTGQEMKQNKTKPTKVNTTKSQKPLNWKGPPQQHRQKGNARTKEPVYNKKRQEKSSKQSSHPAPSRSRH